MFNDRANYRCPRDALWDDGELISWDWVNQQIYEQELRAQYLKVSIELIRVFEELVAVAKDYKDISGRYLPVFGEQGEILAEITFGIARHKLADEIVGDLPDFGTSYKRIVTFYKSLPW